MFWSVVFDLMLIIVTPDALNVLGCPLYIVMFAKEFYVAYRNTGL